jgi:hypothetical protein
VLNSKSSLVATCSVCSWRNERASLHQASDVSATEAAPIYEGSERSPVSRMASFLKFSSSLRSP